MKRDSLVHVPNIYGTSPKKWFHVFPRTKPDFPHENVHFLGYWDLPASFSDSEVDESEASASTASWFLQALGRMRFHPPRIFGGFLKMVVQ